MWKELTAFVFGPRVAGRLPTRIQRAIREQQVQAEILIGWFQLAVVTFLLLLYELAPKTSAGTTFMPVPYVLTAFLLFTLVRTYLAHRRILPSWYLVLSVVVDIGLVLGLIWSFHIQYMQPAAFSLKAPTILYVFIFIALRALRFEPTYVIATGLAAAVGWLAVVWYAVGVADPPSPVTRDYVHYLTANVVLIGAEMDKVIAILLVTLVLSVALVRAERLLRLAVTEQTVARDLTRFVDPQVASRVAGADRSIRPGDAEKKTATILFCDIEGFSTISEQLPPDVLMQTLNEYFDTVAAVVDRYGGIIHQFLGDAILVTFNTARPDPDHAANAVRTALAIQDVVAMRRFGPDLTLKTRCGLNTGVIVFGAVGTNDRLLFTVYGDEVNVAARLEQLNKTYGTYVLATAETMAGAGDTCTGRLIGQVTVRGRTKPVEILAVLPPPVPRFPAGDAATAEC